MVSVLDNNNNFHCDIYYLGNKFRNVKEFRSFSLALFFLYLCLNYYTMAMSPSFHHQHYDHQHTPPVCMVPDLWKMRSKVIKFKIFSKK